MQQILYIQKYIYIYKDNYTIRDIDLSNLFNIDIRKIIKKHYKIFDDNYCYRINNHYLLKKEGIILISMLINSYYLIEITSIILDTIEMLEKINKKIILNKISIDNNI